MSCWSRIDVAGAVLRGSIAAMGIALGVCAAPAASNAAAWDEVVAKAKTEGMVHLYSSAIPQQVERLMAAFKVKYPGIQVSHTRGAGELPPRVATERETGADGADVFLYSDALWYTENDQYVIDLDSPAAATFPDSGWQVKGKAAFLGFPPFGFLVWNTDRVKGNLKDFRDLLKPEFADHIGTREGMTAVLAGYLDFLEKELGPDYLKALGQQKLKFYPSSVPLTQALASGEVWVANIGAIGTLRELKEQGAPVAWTTPKPAGFANPWLGGVLKASKRPNAARVFLDFALTPEGQAAFNGDDSASPRPEVKGEIDLAQYRILRSEDYPKDVRDAWQKRFNEYFRR